MLKINDKSYNNNYIIFSKLQLPVVYALLPLSVSSRWSKNYSLQVDNKQKKIETDKGRCIKTSIKIFMTNARM